MSWFKAEQVTVNNGSNIVTVNSGEDVSLISASDALIVGSFSPVEIKTTYTNGSGDKIIELVSVWSDSSQSNAEARVLPTAGDFIAATTALRDATTNTRDNFAVMDAWGTDMGSVIFTGADGVEYTARTLMQMDADVQSMQDNNQTIIDASVSDALGEIRYSKLDNPLTHLFKKNKLVDTLSGDLTWTRASNATYVDMYGTVKTAEIDEPRQEKEGWLIEGASTNLLTYSEALDNPVWGKNTLTIDAEGEVAPDGVKLSSKLIPNLGSHTGCYTLQTFANDISNYCASIFAKAGEYTLIAIKLIGGSAGLNDIVEVDLTNGAINSNSGDYPATVTHMNDGWYRVDVKGIATAIASPNVRVNVRQSSGTDAITSADGLGGLYVWGAQLEELPFATSYIPTTDSAVTRAANPVSIPCLNNVPLGDQSYSIVMRAIISGYTAYNRLFGADSTDTDERFYSYTDSTGKIYHTNGSDSSRAVTSAVTFGEVFDYVITFDGETYKSYLDGELGAESETISPATKLPSHIKILAGASSNYDSYGNVLDFRVYDFALNESEIKLLSGE